VRLGLWTLEETRNRCDLTEVFKMFYGYTEIEVRVLFMLDVMIRVYVAIVRKFVNQDLIQIQIRKYFFLKSSYSQMEQFGPGHC